MDFVELDLRERLPRVRWNAELRIFLCCLFKFYQRDLGSFTQIFNARFETELREFGFSKGVSYGTLKTQWVDMRRQNDIIWRIIHFSPFDWNGRWLTVIEEIRAVMSLLHLDISEKEHEDIDTSGVLEPSEPPQPQVILALNPQPSSPQPSTTQPPISRGRHMESSTLCTFGDKTCFWCYKEGWHKDQYLSKFDYIPPLLYRWHNVDSQGVNSANCFIAGLFSQATAYFAPGAIEPDSFNRYFVNHVNITHTPSPFISTFVSMLAPVHRALKYGEGASISIIDARKLQTPVFSAKHLVREYGIRVENSNYRGFGEYLIWGRIDQSAIICSFKLTTLLEIATANPGIDNILHLNQIRGFQAARRQLHQKLVNTAPGLTKQVGETVGKLLLALHLPAEYYKDVSMGIAYSWRFKKNKGSWEEYLHGVELSCGQFSSSFFDTTPVFENSEVEKEIITSDEENMSESEMTLDVEEWEGLSSDEENILESKIVMDEASSATENAVPAREEALSVPTIEFIETSDNSILEENHEQITLFSSDDEVVVVEQPMDESNVSSELEFQGFITESSQTDRFIAQRERVRFFMN